MSLSRSRRSKISRSRSSRRGSSSDSATLFSYWAWNFSVLSLARSLILLCSSCDSLAHLLRSATTSFIRLSASVDDLLWSSRSFCNSSVSGRGICACCFAATACARHFSFRRVFSNFKASRSSSKCLMVFSISAHLLAQSTPSGGGSKCTAAGWTGSPDFTALDESIGDATAGVVDCTATPGAIDESASTFASATARRFFISNCKKLDGATSAASRCMRHLRKSDGA
mmetsp:Transcript_56280/g.98278  ORF Transcript_56280/g.98278 Transcript_56280/m.98278 type:complete len:227 (-) Transcript_56280:1204-1884(-)